MKGDFVEDKISVFLSYTNIIKELSRRAFFVWGKMPNLPEFTEFLNTQNQNDQSKVNIYTKRPIPPKVLGFEIFRILGFQLKPQSSPSV